MNKYRPYDTKKCGAADSKYCSNPEQFEKDIEANKQKQIDYEKRILGLFLESPGRMKETYNTFIKVLLEVKRDFNL